MTEHRRLAPSEEAARAAPGTASPDLQALWRDAILQPPTPLITSSEEILQLTAEYDIAPEAGG